MNTNERTVSAFAIYTGINSTLSKQQKRRKARKARKLKAVSIEPNDSVKNVNKKKRKNVEGNGDIRLKKKRKSNFGELQVKNHVKTIKSKRPLEKSNNKSNVSDFLNNSIPGGSGKNAEENRPTQKDSHKKASTVVGKKTKEKINTYQLKKKNIKKSVSKRKNYKTNFIITKSSLENCESNECTAKESFEKIDLQSSSVVENYQPINGSNNHSPYNLVGKWHLNEKSDPTSTVIAEIEKMKNIHKQNKKNKQIFGNELSTSHRKIAIQKCSTESGKELFEDILKPFSSKEFFKDHWEKAPLYVPGNSPTKFSKLLSTPMIDDFLRREVVMFGKHIDITSYKNGKRETHNLEGRALPHVVWDLYNHKCSVRLLCPQAAFNDIFVLNSKLQDYFGCFVGANVYLTPPNSQGFAPHYDDIEAFVLQVEGKKRWKIYSPRNKYETLPRYSSKNFNESDVGAPVMEVTLNPGDFLYFPRGFIHQADTCGNVHSLHITVSVYQKNSWVDLLEKALPTALSNAAREEVDFRRGLPLNFLRHAGIAYHSVSMRKQLIKAVKEKMNKLINYLDIDSAVDMMGMQYVTDALPPVLSYEEASRSVFGNGLRMKNDGQVCGNVSFSGDTKIRFTKAMCHRLVKEMVKSEDNTENEVEEFRLYYSIDNSVEYHGEEPQFLVIPDEYVESIKMLSLNYPAFTRVDTLPLPSLSEQAGLTGDLWDRGLLMTEKPLSEVDVVIESDEEKEVTDNGDKAMKELAGNNEDDLQLQPPNPADSPLTERDIFNGKELDEEEEEEEEIYEKAIGENKQYIRDNELRDSDDEVNLAENLAIISDEEDYNSDNFSCSDEIEEVEIEDIGEHTNEEDMDMFCEDFSDDNWYKNI